MGNTESTAKILIVDDDPAIRQFLTDALKNSFDVVTAEDGAVALELLESDRFDVVLADQMMPKMTGIQLLEETHKLHPETVRILITASTRLEDARDAVNTARVHRYINKPIRVTELQEILVGALRESALENRLRAEKAKVEQLEDLAVHDPITGLYNHAHFKETLFREVKRSTRNGSQFGVVIIDIDHFDKINSELGHKAGDNCLIRLAREISEGGRTGDLEFFLRAQDTIARFGSNSFAFILPDTSKGGAAVMAERLRQYIGACDLTDLGITSQSVSIGVCGFPKDGQETAQLIAAANAALQAAKRRGRDCIVSYVPALAKVSAHQDEGRDEIERLIALEEIIEDKRVTYVYQPIADAKTAEIIAYEALCRPSLEILRNPQLLFETAERAGHILPLGRMCRPVALKAIGDLPENISLFINLHPHEVHDPLLLDDPTLESVAARVVLEITEAAEIHDLDRLRGIISKLRDHGFRLAIDDLGAGYSGLNTLASIQPDFVKLDMALVRGIKSDSSSARLIKHLLEYCIEENIKVVAEGVETAEERDVIRDLGCHYIQGYFYARPSPPFVKVSPEAEG